MKKLLPSQKQFLQTVLTLDRLSLDFTVKMEPDEALEFVRQAPAYNGFSKEGLTDLIQNVDVVIPKSDYGPNNPNTGLPFHWYKIGNQYSRVIYVEFPRSYWPGDKGIPASLARHLEVFGKAANADECDDCSDTTMFRYRFWWD